MAHVYNGLEVKLTGRTAVRKIESKSTRIKSRVDTIHEITPQDLEEGSWKKWVPMSELYEIKCDT